MRLEAALLDAFVAAHPAEAARALEGMPASDAAEVMAILPIDGLAELLRWIAPVAAASSLGLVMVEQAARALSAARRDVAVTILRSMDSEHRSTIMDSLKLEERKVMGRLLRYADGTAGAMMDPQVLAVVESVTVADALERLRKNPQHALYYVYVVSEDQRLVGVANIRELMGARSDQLLGLIAVREVEALPARASWESIVTHPGWKRVHALPVVETDGRFIGAVRYESVRELEERSAAAGLEDHGARTGAALGELYALGLRGLFEWALAAVLGSAESREGRS